MAQEVLCIQTTFLGLISNFFLLLTEYRIKPEVFRSTLILMKESKLENVQYLT